MALLSDLFDQDGKPMENDPLAIARALAGMKPQTQGTAFEPVTPQQQLSNYRQLEGQQQAWQTAEGSPWKPAEPGPVAQMLSRILQSEPGQRAMLLADFMGPGPKVPRPAMSAAGSGGGAPKGIKAFHGSPHDFDRFDLSKIGTGEGAQVFGKGLYFAENEATARAYRDGLSPATYGGKLFNPTDTAQLASHWVARNNGDTAKARADIERIIAGTEASRKQVGNTFADNQISKLNAAIKYIDDGLPSLEQGTTGRLYEVQIKTDPERLIEWEKPWTEQAPAVRQAIRDAASKMWGENGLLKRQGKTLEDTIGPNAHQLIAKNDAGVQMLREAGIPGIRYKDAGSRGAEGGTNNYVVFDDALVEIVRKYGIAGLMAAMGLTATDKAEAGQK